MFDSARSISSRYKKSLVVLTLVAGTALSSVASAVDLRNIERKASALSSQLNVVIDQLRNGGGHGRGRLWTVADVQGVRGIRELADIVHRANREQQRLVNVGQVNALGGAARALNVAIAEAMTRDAWDIRQRVRLDFPRNEGPFHHLQGSGIHAGANAVAFTGITVAAAVAITRVVSGDLPIDATQAFAASALAAGAGYKFFADFVMKVQDTRDFFKRRNVAYRTAESDIRETTNYVAVGAWLTTEVNELLARTASTNTFLQRYPVQSANVRRVAQDQQRAVQETYSRITRARGIAAGTVREFINEERENDQGR